MKGIVHMGSKWTPRFLSWSFQVLFGPSRYGIESSICDNLEHQKRCSEVLFFLECSFKCLNNLWSCLFISSSIHKGLQWPFPTTKDNFVLAILEGKLPLDTHMYFHMMFVDVFRMFCWCFINVLCSFCECFVKDTDQTCEWSFDQFHTQSKVSLWASLWCRPPLIWSEYGDCGIEIGVYEKYSQQLVK